MDLDEILTLLSKGNGYNPDVIKEGKETNIQAEKDRDEYRTLKRGNDYEILL